MIGNLLKSINGLFLHLFKHNRTEKKILSKDRMKEKSGFGSKKENSSLRLHCKIDLILLKNVFISVNLNNILFKSWEMDRNINPADEKDFHLHFILKTWSPICLVCCI